MSNYTKWKQRLKAARLTLMYPTCLLLYILGFVTIVIGQLGVRASGFGQLGNGFFNTCGSLSLEMAGMFTEVTSEIKETWV